VIGNGLRLFVSDKDLRWSGYDAAGLIEGDMSRLVAAVRMALCMFNSLPEPRPDDLRVEVQREASKRGFDITVSSTMLSMGWVNPVPLTVEPRITKVDVDGVHLAILGTLTAIPVEGAP